MNEWFLNYTNDNWGLGILNRLTKVLQQSSIRISTWTELFHLSSIWFLSLKHSCSILLSFNSVQSLSHVQLFVTPWTAACQASLSITNSRSLLKFMSIESVMPSNHLILCYPLLLLPSIFPNIRVFSNELALSITWPKYWSFSFNISPSNEHPGSQQMFNDSNKLMWVKANLCFPLMYLETEFQNKASPVLYVI